MSNIIERIDLIFVDAVANNNKVWRAYLYENNDVRTEWGRVGNDNFQSKMFTGRGERFFRNKTNEKLRHGYTKLPVITDATSISNTDNLNQIAREQIAKGNPILTRLVDQLVRANIHKITSNTNIKYNQSTGLFSTPVGIVTLDAIIQARSYLDIIALRMRASDYTSDEMISAVNKYLRLIPQDVGRRLGIRVLFTDEDAIAKQSDILDSLEASYRTVMAGPHTDAETVAEQVFNLDIDVMGGTKIAERLNQWFEASKRAVHNYSNIKVNNIYGIKIHEMDKGFNKNLGNIKEVWHGSSEANALSILKSGLRVSPPSTAARAGAMFGAGIYGALESSKSLGYSLGRWNQGGVGKSAWLFVCQFAMGKCYETQRACTLPHGYDSIWARKGVSLYHDELIVPKDNQVNITYLLECK